MRPVTLQHLDLMVLPSTMAMRLFLFLHFVHGTYFRKARGAP